MTDEEFAKWLAETLRDTSSGCWLDDDDLTSVIIDGEFDLVKFAKAIRDKLERPGEP